MTVKVEGLSKLADAPGWLDNAQRRFLNRAVDRLGDEVRKRAPGGPNGRAARDVRSRTETSTRGVVESAGWEAAPVLERGGTIRPKGQALRLHDGRFIHRSSWRRRGSGGAAPGAVFIPGRHYFRKGLRGRARIVRDTFAEAFDDIERNPS